MNVLSNKKNLLLLYFSIAAITFIVFIPSLSLHFVDWDDPEYLLKNKDLVVFGKSWSWHAIYSILTSKVGANYNPLPVVTYAIEQYLFARDPHAAPFIFHLDNVLLHIGCTVCVFALFLKMGVNRTGAFLGAVLFGIHPMRVESVSWITERKDVLYGFFYLLTLLMYVNYIQKGQRKWYVFAVLFSLFSYFSKIQAVSLPLSMIALDIYFQRKWYLRQIFLYEKLPWWLLSVIIGLVNMHLLNTLHVINSEPQLVNYTLFDKLAVGAYAYMVYLVKFVYPYQMLHWYVYPVKLPMIAYICLIAMPFLIAVFLWKWYKDRAVVFGWLFFSVNILFLLQIIPAGKAFLADRFTYIAYIGLFFIVAVVYDRLSARYKQAKNILPLSLAGYMLLLGFITVQQEKIWKNTSSLWEHYIKVLPRSTSGYAQLGGDYISVALAKSDLNMEMPEEELKQRGFLYLKKANDLDSLDKRPNKSLTLSIFEGLGTCYGALGKYDSAEYYFTRQLGIVSREVGLFPNNKEVYADRALTYYKGKKYDLALNDYRTFLKFDPANDGAYYRCAMCEGFLGQFRDGLKDINKAISIDSTQADYYYTRSKLYRLLNVVDSARTDALKAKKMGAVVGDKWLL